MGMPELNFDECERMLRDDLIIDKFLHIDEKNKQRQCVLLLSEIFIHDNVNLGDFLVEPLKRELWNPFKSYLILLHIPGKYAPSSFHVSEVVSVLLSFIFRRRIISSRWSADCNEKNEKHYTEYRTYRLPFKSVGPEASLQGSEILKEDQKEIIIKLHKLYDLLLKVDEEDYLTIIRSMRLYQNALLIYKDDPGVAYTLLVASVETMAEKYIKKSKFNNFSNKNNYQGWIKLMEKLSLNDCQKDGIKKYILKQEKFSSKKFRKFIMDYLPDSFWSDYDSRSWKEFEWFEKSSPFPESLKEYLDRNYKLDIEEIIKDLQHFLSKEGLEILIKYIKGDVVLSDKEELEFLYIFKQWWAHRLYKGNKEELEDILKDIYNMRSQLVHSGKPPHKSIRDNYETITYDQIIEHENKYEIKIKTIRNIPSFYWFERIVFETTWNFLTTMFQKYNIEDSY